MCAWEHGPCSQSSVAHVCLSPRYDTRPLPSCSMWQIAASCLMAGAYRSVNLSWVDCYYGGASSSGSNVRALLSAVQLAGSQWSHVHTSLLLQGFTQDGVMSRSCQDLSNVCVRKLCVRVWLCSCLLHVCMWVIASAVHQLQRLDGQRLEQ